MELGAWLFHVRGQQYHDSMLTNPFHSSNYAVFFSTITAGPATLAICTSLQQLLDKNYTFKVVTDIIDYV